MHIRYNQAGYFPHQTKSIIIQSDVDIALQRWCIATSQNQIVCEGVLNQSIQGITEYTPKSYNYTIDFSHIQTCGTYVFSIDSHEISILISESPYSAYAHDVLYGIRARRSASNNSLIHGYSHGGDAACDIFMRVNNSNSEWNKRDDGKQANMLGGWYDAGDYMKFTHTIAYTTYFLLLAYEHNPLLFSNVFSNSHTDLNDLLDEAKYGLDFLMKTLPEKDIFIIQVGGHLDHTQGERLPEHDTLDGARECYAALSKPQMGLTVAALALGARIFATTSYSHEAQNYKEKALEIFYAAIESNEPPAWNETDKEVFYADSTSNDNMELAAIELFKCTQNVRFLQEATQNVNNQEQVLWASWAHVGLHAHALLIPFYKEIIPKVESNLRFFKQIGDAENNIWHTPHESTWGTLYSYFSVANAAFLFKQATGSSEFHEIQYHVLDFLFGVNPWGIAFIASEKLAHSISSTYAIMYRIQPHIFPRGEIAEGPTTKEIHNANNSVFNPPHNAQLWHAEFNTNTFTFFEQPGDYICMETTITGLADGLFLLATAH